MSHDGGPSPMYWVIWSVSEFPEFSRFFVHNMEFLYCLDCQQSSFPVSGGLSIGDLLGDLKGDPILIPCLASEAEAGFVPRLQDLRWEYG